MAMSNAFSWSLEMELFCHQCLAVGLVLLLMVGGGQWLVKGGGRGKMETEGEIWGFRFFFFGENEMGRNLKSRNQTCFV